MPKTSAGKGEGETPERRYPMSKPSIPVDSTGIDLRDTGMEAVIASDLAAHRDAGHFIRNTIREYAERGVEFTADDIREALKDNMTVVRELNAKPNLLPAHMGIASQARLIRAVGMYRPSRASRRASRNLVWIGAR